MVAKIGFFNIKTTLTIDVQAMLKKTNDQHKKISYMINMDMIGPLKKDAALTLYEKETVLFIEELFLGDY